MALLRRHGLTGLPATLAGGAISVAVDDIARAALVDLVDATLAEIHVVETAVGLGIPIKVDAFGEWADARSRLLELLAAMGVERKP